MLVGALRPCWGCTAGGDKEQESVFRCRVRLSSRRAVWVRVWQSCRRPAPRDLSHRRGPQRAAWASGCLGALGFTGPHAMEVCVGSVSHSQTSLFTTGDGAGGGVTCTVHLSACHSLAVACLETGGKEPRALLCPPSLSLSERVTSGRPCTRAWALQRLFRPARPSDWPLEGHLLMSTPISYGVSPVLR